MLAPAAGSEVTVKTDFETLGYEEDGGVAWVTLDRPDVHNAFNGEMVGSLRRCFEDAAKEQDLRAIVLSGQGASFCAGADLKAADFFDASLIRELDNEGFFARFTSRNREDRPKP